MQIRYKPASIRGSAEGIGKVRKQHPVFFKKVSDEIEQHPMLMEPPNSV